MIRKVGFVLTSVGVVWLIAAMNMETSVLPPLRTNEFGMWDGQLPSRVENIGLIARRENHIIVASLLTLIGTLLILFGGNRGWKSPSEKSAAGVECAEPPATRDLSNDEYRLWLAERYSIARNDLFDVYVVDRKTFPDLASALSHAHSLELENEEQRQIDAEITAKEKEARREDRANNWGLQNTFTRAIAIGVAVTLTGGTLLFLSDPENAESRQEGTRLSETTSSNGSDAASDDPAAQDEVFEAEADTQARDRQVNSLTDYNLSVAYLTGSWSWHPSCGTELAIEYRQNGTYTDGSVNGRYAVDDDTIRYTSAERAYGDDPSNYMHYPSARELEDHSMTVTIISNDSMRVGGGVIYRC